MVNIRHDLLMVGLNVTNMHITLTLPGDGTHDFLIQSQTFYYHDTPTPWIHKALKTSHNSTSQKVSKKVSVLA